uniref:Uncharacterized protein n=1 Tax=Cacopsylla melanoneura TaxID=428564 RepID=A0A8D8PKS9_9HEMI
MYYLWSASISFKFNYNMVTLMLMLILFNMCLITFAYAEGDKFNVDVIDTELLDKVENNPLTPHSKPTVQFHWRISVTRTTETPYWTSIKGDISDPYRKVVTLLYETFQNPSHRENVWNQAKGNYSQFMINLRLQGPDKFVESFCDTQFMLLSDLLEKQKMWRDNWHNIVELFDMIGPKGFDEMMQNVHVSPTTEDFVSNSNPTYWTPGPHYYTQHTTVWTPEVYYYTPGVEEDLYDRAFRRFSPPPPGCFTCPYEATPTPPQGIIHLPVCLNHTSVESTEPPSIEETTTIRTTRTTKQTVQPPFDPELEAVLERHWNRTFLNSTQADGRPFVEQKPEGHGERDHARNFFYEEYDETVVCTTGAGGSTLPERTLRILTHSFT